VRGHAIADSGLLRIFSLRHGAACDVAVGDYANWPLTIAGYAALGAWAGLGFMLGELPNSFVKRQLDIAPGMAPRGTLAAIGTFVVDRVDSILGMLAFVSIATPTPWLTWGYALFIGPGIHLAFSVLLHRLGVKARPA
jgi:hypothetical protein